MFWFLFRLQQETDANGSKVDSSKMERTSSGRPLRKASRNIFYGCDSQEQEESSDNIATTGMKGLTRFPISSSYLTT